MNPVGWRPSSRCHQVRRGGRGRKVDVRRDLIGDVGELLRAEARVERGKDHRRVHCAVAARSCGSPRPELVDRPSRSRSRPVRAAPRAADRARRSAFRAGPMPPRVERRGGAVEHVGCGQLHSADAWSAVHRAARRRASQDDAAQPAQLVDQPDLGPGLGAETRRSVGRLEEQLVQRVDRRVRLGAGPRRARAPSSSLPPPSSQATSARSRAAIARQAAIAATLDRIRDRRRPQNRDRERATRRRRAPSPRLDPGSATPVRGPSPAG